LVPLDADPDTGWTTVGNNIQLPTAVCDRLKSGDAKAVAVTTACPSKTASLPPCGDWSSVTAEQATIDAGAPLPVAAGGSASNGGTTGAGGATSSGGSVSVGGVSNRGGSTSTGGTTSVGGAKGTGGAVATGGSAGTDGAFFAGLANCGTPTSAIGNFTISYGNYFSVGAYAGYGFVYITRAPGGNNNTFTCPTSTFGTSTSALCGAGSIPADSSNQTVAGIGFNLNEAASDANSPQPIGMIVDTATIRFVNNANSDLRIEIERYATDTGSTYYCYEAKGKSSPLTLKASDFTTTCWDSANPGSPWDGTAARSPRLIIPCSTTATIPFDACIENVTLTAATTGTGGTGGTTGTGGTVTTIGGGVATGGTKATGGTTTAGGTTSMGGTNPTGGTSTTGGSGGNTCATAGAAGRQIINSFDSASSVSQFQIDTYVPTDCATNSGAANDAGASLQLTWSGAVDYNSSATTKGAMALVATFTGWNQEALVHMNGPSGSCGQPLDLTNKIVTAQILFTSGLSPNPNTPFGAVIAVKTGSSYVWGSSPWVNISALNQWITLSLDMASPQGVPSGQTYDPTDPVQLEIQILTGGGGESTWCTGNHISAFGAPVQSVIYVDQITMEDGT
jgi:hypothetical protein